MLNVLKLHFLMKYSVIFSDWFLIIESSFFCTVIFSSASQEDFSFGFLTVPDAPPGVSDIPCVFAVSERHG